MTDQEKSNLLMSDMKIVPQILIQSSYTGETPDMTEFFKYFNITFETTNGFIPIEQNQLTFMNESTYLFSPNLTLYNKVKWASNLFEFKVNRISLQNDEISKSVLSSLSIRSGCSYSKLDFEQVKGGDKPIK